jgi:hypothetical protein
LQATIVLIDGTQLADLLIEFGVWVSDVETIRLKRVDEDYFGDGLERRNGCAEGRREGVTAMNMYSKSEADRMGLTFYVGHALLRVPGN